MAFDPSRVKRKIDSRPARCIFYGPEGVGKTTLASQFPEPIFLQFEDGAGDLEIASATDGRLITKYAEVVDIIEGLRNHDHDFETIVIDSLDWMEPVIFAETCVRNEYRTINTDKNGKPNFSQGYPEAAKVWREFTKGLDLLRDEKGMNVVCLAHAKAAKIEPPDAPKYERYTIKIQEKGESVLIEWADVIGFMTPGRTVVEADKAKGERKNKAHSTGRMMAYFDSGRPQYVAKGRYRHFPSELVLPQEAPFSVIRPHLPNFRNSDEASSEPAAIAAE